MNTETTNTPWAVYSKEVPIMNGGTIFEHCIGTAADHPQLKAPAPIVTTSVSARPNGKGQTTVYLRLADAELICRAVNAHEAMKDAMQFSLDCGIFTQGCMEKLRAALTLAGKEACRE